MKNMINDNHGMALPMVLLAVAVFVIIGLGCLTMAWDEMKLVRNYEEGVQAYYLAEAALNKTAGNLNIENKTGEKQEDIIHVIYDNPEDAVNQSKEYGRFQVTMASLGNVGEVQITATARAGRVIRRIAATITHKEEKAIFRDYTECSVEYFDFDGKPLYSSPMLDAM